jgi:hypothetical protein
MKNICFIALCIGFLQAEAQFLQAPGNYVESKKTNERQKSNPIWSEDFSNGIPADWINTGSPSLAIWEYRGPQTNPSNLIGSRGSCIPDGLTGEPIASSSSANGFLIFDSNYWDNDQNPCTAQYFGSGLAPGPHNASITTGSINLSGHPNVALQFEQYARYYSGETSVEISINGGAWNTLYTNNFDQGLTTENTLFVRVPLPAEAGNSSDVRLKFVYNGLYYFWQIDDLEIIDIFANDVLTEQTTYGDFDNLDPTHVTGFEYMEYDQYPVDFAPELFFQGEVFNFGTNNQSNVSLSATLTHDETSTQLYSGTSVDSLILNSGISAPFEIGTFQMPNTIGHYTIDFTSNQTETDNNLTNNTQSRSFEITPVTYARDKGDLNAVFIPADNYLNSTYDMGCVYLLPAGDFVESIGVALAVGTTTPSSVYATIFSFSLDTGIGNAIASTIDYPVTPEDINGYGEENIKILEFENPVYLSQGAYLVTVGSPEGPGSVYIGLSGYSEELTAWVRFNQTDLFYLTRIPMVRMNFGPYVGTEEYDFENDFSMFPNPANQQTTFQFPSKEAKTISVFGMNGSLIEEFQVSENTPNFNLNVAAYSAGLYRVIVRSGGKINSTHLVIE